MKILIIIMVMFFTFCGIIENPNKSDMIKKCKREEFDKLFVIGTCRPKELSKLSGCFEMLYVAYMGCEKKDYTISFE